ncbi:ABC-three component system protein [Rhodomicrobium vannielii]|uniref:ABC-three component system protein n=1 Tax=Rhodomicrobium vannielii TaxID=1069 RepID=UPI001AEC60D1|nr:ABC-three component system protein [Rhodomicrobium vannielii]
MPVKPLDRVAQFSPAEFERFTLEWVSGYIAIKVPEIVEVQQRGGSGDKGRDVIAWLDPSTARQRRWRLYQCKHYGGALGAGVAAAEIAKVMYYTMRGDYSPPEQYYFVTHKGVTSPFQDLLDKPNELKAYIIQNWDKYCRKQIRDEPIALSDDLRAHIKQFDFSIFRAKQPHELIEEHSQTRYHLTVFGLPLIQRARPPQPPSEVAPRETVYVHQLFKVISNEIGAPVSGTADFVQFQNFRSLFDRSRITFYCAEGLKELARDQMADVKFFDTLLTEFCDGLFHWYSDSTATGFQRLTRTVKGAQQLQLGTHLLAQHVLANDREGMCHQLANEGLVRWCE